jgi:hypothetical protein
VNKEGRKEGRTDGRKDGRKEEKEENKRKTARKKGEEGRNHTPSVLAANTPPFTSADSLNVSDVTEGREDKMSDIDKRKGGREEWQKDSKV